MDRQTRAVVQSWLRAHGGVIARNDALSLGLTDDLIASLVDSGEWRRAHAGVYVPANVKPTHRLDVLAAVAALGDGAAASHGSAAWFQKLVDRPPVRPELVVPYGRGGRLKGAVVHRSRCEPMVLRFGGVPCTEPLRTLLDIASSRPAQVDTAVDRALSSGLVRITDLEAATRPGQGGGRRGSVALRGSLLQRGYVGAPQPSVLESRMARLLRGAPIPQPRTEVTLGSFGEYRVDSVFEDVRLVVETNGYVWHFSPEHQAHDHARQNSLVASGCAVLVYTWVQVVRDGQAVLNEIVSVYAQRSQLAG
jgi:hypothetical protein